MDNTSDSWNPDAYLGFANDRTRPALELISRIAISNPTSIVDLGCGAGNVTAILRKRWKDAAISGVDNSPAMLARAKTEYPDKNINWKLENINDWVSDRRYGTFDIVFSNAALHWVGKHGDLFPQLMSRVTTGGVLAETVAWTFSTPPPQMQSSYPNRGPHVRDPLMFVAFDQRIDPAAVLETIAVKAGRKVFPVVLAEAEIPLAIADAFKKGNLGIMDYYRLRNIQADTDMRSSISGDSKPEKK